MATLFLDLAGTLVDLDAYRRGETANLCFLQDELLPELSWLNCILVTASPQAQVDAILALTGLDQKIYWKELVTAERDGDQKASGEPFRARTPSFSGPWVHVGDSHADEEGAARAHIFFVRVYPQSTFSSQQRELTRALRRAISLLKLR